MDIRDAQREIMVRIRRLRAKVGGDEFYWSGMAADYESKYGSSEEAYDKGFKYRYYDKAEFCAEVEKFDGLWYSKRRMDVRRFVRLVNSLINKLFKIGIDNKDMKTIGEKLAQIEEELRKAECSRASGRKKKKSAKGG